ncbi:hypothetical protein BJX76DRAFT_349285 [Aspergillus varians]
MRCFACPCDSCDKRQEFVRKADLARHYQIHLDDRPFVCPEEGCTKRFHQRSSLKIHQRIHTGEKPYICEPSSYARHQRSHNNVKPYVCCIGSCNQSFSRKAALDRHQLRNHEQGNRGLSDPQLGVAFPAPLPDNTAPSLPYHFAVNPSDLGGLDFSVIDDILEQTIIPHPGPHLSSYPDGGHAQYPDMSQP